MTTYTIITTENELQVDIDRYRFDDMDDLYCYRDGDSDVDGDDDPVAHVPADRFVAIFESEHGTTTPLP